MDEGNALTVAPASTVSVAPCAYKRGVAVGWKRFALSGDVTHVDLGGKPGSAQSVDMGVSYTGRRASGRVKATATRPLADTPRLIADDPSYSIDVGGRSEERRVGKECVSTFRFRWPPYHYKKKKTNNY